MDEPEGAADGLPPAPWVLAGVLTLVGLVFLPTLRFGFVYDDGWTLLSNGFLREGRMVRLLGPEAASWNVPDPFRPTLVLFDTLTYRLFGLSATWHHALSVSVHVGVCLALWRVLTRLGADAPLRACATLCFGLMALHAEPVAVVSFREDLLAALLGLSAVAVGLAASERERWAELVPLALVALVLEALAVGAKASAAPIPVFFLLAAGLSPWREPGPRVRRWAVAAALFIGAGLAVGQRLLAMGGLDPYGATDSPRLMSARAGTSRVLAASTQIHAEYLRQLVIPTGLSPEYPDRVAAWSDPATLLCAAGLLGLFGLGVGFAARRRRPLPGLAILGAFALALPTANLVGMPNMRADRFTYLWSAPVAMGLAAALLAVGRWFARGDAEGSERDRARVGVEAEPASLAALLPVIAFALIQGSVAGAAQRAYGSNITLWTAAAHRAPGSARAQAMHGLHLLLQAPPRPNLDPALAARVAGKCEAALAHDALDPLGHTCLGRLAVAERRWADADAHFARALELDPVPADRLLAARIQLSLDLPGLSQDQRSARAFDRLAEGLASHPYSPELRVAGARVLHRLGHPRPAMYLYRRARSLRPERSDTVLGGLELAIDLGDVKAARRTALAEAPALDAANQTARHALNRRLAHLERHRPTPLIHSLLSPGVFPDESP